MSFFHGRKKSKKEGGKMANKETKNKVGRPSAVTEETLRKLEEAFKLGCTNREACFYADLAESTFYDFLKKYPEYSEKIEIWKSYEKIKARMVVHRALEDNDKEMAKWYLERKAKDEFSTKEVIEANITTEEKDKNAIDGVVAQMKTISEEDIDVNTE